MKNPKINLFLKDVSHFENMFDAITADYPELKPLMDDLLYPMKFLQSLADEATGVLKNNSNSIEQMRFLLNPATVEEHDIRDAVSELLPSKDEDYDKLDCHIDIDDSLIHFGELLIIALAAGRAGMNKFNLTDSIDEYIDIVKFNALATLPLQVLAGVLRTGRSIDNFIQSYLHQAKSSDNFIFLKTLVKTFWDKRGLASARNIEIITKEVKAFFTTCSLTSGWDGTKTIAIRKIELKPKSDSVKYPIHVHTNYSGEKEKIIAYFVWDSVNDGDNRGFVTKIHEFPVAKYQKQKNIFIIDDCDHPSGWLGLQLDSEQKEMLDFAKQLAAYWEEKNKSISLLENWPIPLCHLPHNDDQEPQNDLVPVIEREQSNKWGPEILEESISYLTEHNNDGEATHLAELKLRFRSHVTPSFTVSNYESNDAHEFSLSEKDRTENTITLFFNLDELSENDTFILVDLYTDEREDAYDTELVELGNWQQYIADNSATDDNGDSTGDNSSDGTGDGDSSGDGGSNGQPDGSQNTTIPIFVIRPGILESVSEDTQEETNMASVFQVDENAADEAIYTLTNSVNYNFQEKSLPFNSDSEVTVEADDIALDEAEQIKLLKQLKFMSETTLGQEKAVWISLVKSDTPFYRVALSTGSNGLIVSTTDKLVEAFEELKRRVNPANPAKSEDTIAMQAHVFNGALSIDKFVSRQRRILQNNDDPVPSQWIAIGYYNNRQLAFEQRINLPSEHFTGIINLNVPDDPNLEKIELRYQPELFAIEVASVTQPRLTEASVRLMSNASVLRGNTFRQVTPSPKKRLIVLQRKAGDLTLIASYNENRNALNWRERHSSGIETRVSVYVENSHVTRVFDSFPKNVNSLDLNNFVIKDTEQEELKHFEITVSDGWNSKSATLSNADNQFSIDARDLLPRRASGNIYWVDPGSYSDNVNSNTRVYWKIDGEDYFDNSVSIFNAVELPDNIDKSQIEIEIDDDHDNDSPYGGDLY